MFSLGHMLQWKISKKAALTINWMCHEGSKLVNSWDNDKWNTAKESWNNLCDTSEHVFKPESSTLLSKYQFHKPQCEKGHTVDQWMTVLCTQANQCTLVLMLQNTFVKNL